MLNSLHLLRHNLSRANIHMFVNLHGIRRNDSAIDALCKFDGQCSFSDRGRTGQNDHWFLLTARIHHTILLNFFSISYLLMDMIVGRPCGQL